MYIPLILLKTTIFIIAYLFIILNGFSMAICILSCYTEKNKNSERSFYMQTNQNTSSLCDTIRNLTENLDLRSGYLNISDLHFHTEYREICRQNSCRSYGTSWACPPAVGTEQECMDRLKSYDKMLLFSKVYQLEDSFDIEGISEGGADFRRRVETLAQQAGQLLPHYLMMANGGCRRCESCTYPHSPCRFPDQVFHSMSSYMFTVSSAAKLAGLAYNNGPDTVTFFGAILFHENTQT